MPNNVSAQNSNISQSEAVPMLINEVKKNIIHLFITLQ